MLQGEGRPFAHQRRGPRVSLAFFCHCKSCNPLSPVPCVRFTLLCPEENTSQAISSSAFVMGAASPSRKS